MREVTPTAVRGRLDAGADLVLLDVREADEVAHCRIAGAVHIPMGDVPARLSELDPDRDLVVYCHHGVRSAAVANFLRQQGFKAVNLEGGVDQWARAIDPTMRRY